MMSTTPAHESQEQSTATADEALSEVRRRLVGIHASVAESLSTDPTVVPWVESELADLLRYIKTARPVR